MNVTDIIAAVLDQPALQEPAAAFIAGVLKAKLPAGFEKDTKDLLTLVVSKL